MFSLSSWLAAALVIVALPSVQLEDQRRQKHDTAAVFGGDRVTVVIGGDERETGEAIRDWVKLLPSTTDFRIYGIANLDGVPFFVPNQAIRDNLNELLPRVAVLCDFEGETYARLEFPRGAATAQVFYRGRRIGRVLGPASPEKAAQLISLVRTATRS